MSKKVFDPIIFMTDIVMTLISLASFLLASWKLHKSVIRGMPYGKSKSRGSGLWISHYHSLPGFALRKLDFGKLRFKEGRMDKMEG